MKVASGKSGSAGIEKVLQYQPQIAAFEILARARVEAVGSGYAGDLSPQKAWALFSSGIADLIDVRTKRELKNVGYVPNAKHIEWLRDADMLPNPRFIYELNSKVGKDDVVLLLCRSGKRSVAAAQAATQAGFKHVFNVLEGFEGGWLRHNLPWARD